MKISQHPRVMYFLHYSLKLQGNWHEVRLVKALIKSVYFVQKCSLSTCSLFVGYLLKNEHNIVRLILMYIDILKFPWHINTNYWLISWTFFSEYKYLFSCRVMLFLDF